MDGDRFAGTLMVAGGLLGLVGTVSTVFPFSVLGVISFGLVLVFGNLVYRKRPEARLVSAATIWFAPLGGAAAYVIFSFAQADHVPTWVVQGAVGVVGSGIAFTGAVVHRLRIRL